MVATLREHAPTKAEVAQMAQRVIMARHMAAQAKAATREAEEDFIITSTLAGVDTVELADGTLVTRIDADRRKIDAKVLANRATATAFDQVTKRTVDHKKFDSAVELGIIDKATVEAVVTATPYSAIRVTKA